MVEIVSITKKEQERAKRRSKKRKASKKAISAKMTKALKAEPKKKKEPVKKKRKRASSVNGKKRGPKVKPLLTPTAAATALTAAIAVLDEIMADAVLMEDPKTRLTALKEKNKLQALYKVDPSEAEARKAEELTKVEEEQKAMLQQLQQFKFVDADAPLSEHFRVAISRLVDNGCLPNG